MDEDDATPSTNSRKRSLTAAQSIGKRLERLPSSRPCDDDSLEHLRVVAEIAEHHRSAVDEPADNARTESGDPHAARASADIRAPEARGSRSLAAGVTSCCGGKIGAGAFGEVFHAHDVWLDHPVALKLLKPEIAQSDFSNRILHEARRLARVRHPNVVNVHGADMHDGRIGFWMDLIEGETLDRAAVAGRLSHGEASHIGRKSVSRSRPCTART